MADHQPTHAPPTTGRIPGVRYRTEKRQRPTTVVIDGIAEQTTETYYVQVPIPPRDWDGVLLRGITAAAIGTTAVSVAWSTASIGDLLDASTPAAVAYGAASVFDTGWIVCQGVEWLERYDQERAKVARNAGLLALAVAVVAIVVHGRSTGDTPTGLVGGAVSVIAKGLWIVVMRHYRVPLSEGAAGWLRGQRQRVAVRRAVGGAVRSLRAEDAYVTEVYGPEVREVTRPAPAPIAPPVSAAPVVPAPSAAPVPHAQPEGAPAPPAAPPTIVYSDPRCAAIRPLYDNGTRPGTKAMRAAILTAHGTAPGDSTIRGVIRAEVEEHEPMLATYPPALPAPRTA